MNEPDPSVKIDIGIHALIDEEFSHAHWKHEGLTPRSWRVDDAGSLVVLVEEVGEVARALTYDEGDRDNLARELIQVATMAAAWAERLLIRGDL